MAARALLHDEYHREYAQAQDAADQADKMAGGQGAAAAQPCSWGGWSFSGCGDSSQGGQGTAVIVPQDAPSMSNTVLAVAMAGVGVVLVVALTTALCTLWRRRRRRAEAAEAQRRGQLAKGAPTPRVRAALRRACAVASLLRPAAHVELPCWLPLTARLAPAGPAEAEERRVREVVIPVLVLGPDESVHVAFDAAAPAAEQSTGTGSPCSDACAGQPAAPPAAPSGEQPPRRWWRLWRPAGGSAVAPARPVGDPPAQCCSGRSSPAVSMEMGSSDTTGSSRSSDVGGDPGPGRSLVVRLQLRGPHSVLTVADVAAVQERSPAGGEPSAAGAGSPPPAAPAAAPNAEPRL